MSDHWSNDSISPGYSEAKMASYSPTLFSARLRNMIGPKLVIVTTSRIESTTINTEQNDRQNWHLCRPMSLHDCLMKNLNFWQHERDEPELRLLSSLFLDDKAIESFMSVVAMLYSGWTVLESSFWSESNLPRLWSTNTVLSSYVVILGWCMI